MQHIILGSSTLSRIYVIYTISLLVVIVAVRILASITLKSTERHDYDLGHRKIVKKYFALLYFVLYFN